MVSINDLILVIEDIKKNIFPIIKFLAEFEKQFLNLILEKLIILPDFSYKENKEKKGTENFHDFMKNLNISFYANIPIFNKEFQNYLSVSKTLEIYARYNQEIRSYNYDFASAYFAFAPQILPIYEKIGNIANSNYEFIYGIINSMYKSQEVYDKSGAETEGGKIYESNSFAPQILPIYEKIGEVSNITYEIISNLIGSNINGISKTSEYKNIWHKNENISSSSYSYLNLSSVLEVRKTFENTAKENIIEMSNLARYLNEVLNEVVERTTSTVNTINRYISSNLYEHNKGSEFMNSIISYENTKIDYASSLISAAAPSTVPATVNNKTINNAFNISITVKSTSEEQELRELGKKIGKIINEEIRRAGI